MKKRVLVSVITSMLIITGCSVEDLEKLEKTNSEDMQSTTNLEETSIDVAEDLNYMIRGSCAYYDMFYDRVDNKSWFRTYGSSADSLKINLVSNQGSIIQKINPDKHYYRNSLRIYNLVETGTQNEDLLRSHTDDNVLIKCIYKDDKANKEQVFHQMVSLGDFDLWKKTVHYGGQPNTENNVLLHTSMLTDLYYKIYLKNFKKNFDKELSFKAADSFMSKSFPKTFYKESNFIDQKGDFFDSRPIIENKNTAQAQYYKKLNNLAWKYTDKRVDFLNDLIADNYEAYYLNDEGCIDQWICGSIFPNATTTIIDDPEFNKGLDSWIIEENLYANATGSINKQLISNNPRKYNIKMDLKSNHGKVDVSPSLSIHQEYQISNSDELDEIYFKIKSKSLLGTAHPFAGFIFSSGLAGYYACFNDSSGKELGCMIVADYSDPITLPILIGEMFKVESKQDFYIVKGVRDPFEDSFNLGKIIKEHLPSVKNNLSKVKSVTIGAFVSEATPDGMCVKCDARLEAEKISLEKIK